MKTSKIEIDSDGNYFVVIPDEILADVGISFQDKVDLELSYQINNDWDHLPVLILKKVKE